MDKKTKAKILAILSEHVTIPKKDEDRVIDGLYKAYVEVREEQKV